MKLNLLAALLLCSSLALAASETATVSTEHGKSASAPAHGKAHKKAKKVKKNKKDKEEKKADGAQAVPSAMSSQSSAAVAAPAAGTSTAQAPAVAAPAKKWGVTLLNESSIDYAGGKNVGEAVVSTANYVGASYKITTTEKVGLRQYYSYDYDPKSYKEFESHDINQSFTVATLSTKTKGILGSDELAPMFWYYMPGHTAEETNFKKDMDSFYGILRADAEIAWTLNPRWSVSYYLNPRQTLGAKDEEAKFEATSRLIQYGNLYYNVNDATQLYFNAGLDHKMATERLTSTSDAYLSAIGASVSFFGGKLTLNPEINTSAPLKTKGSAEVSQRLYKKENIGYTLATVIAL